MFSSLFYGYFYNSLLDNWSTQYKKNKVGVGFRWGPDLVLSSEGVVKQMKILLVGQHGSHLRILSSSSKMRNDVAKCR